MKVLIACEESQRVCTEFRNLDQEAYSCDILDPSGGHPEWHIKQDVIPLLNGNCSFKTMDGTDHTIPAKWDLIIAHPPCTYLTVTGNRWFNVERYGDKARLREKERELAIQFFMQFANADCDHIAIENPVGIISTVWRKPDQIIQPYEYGHPERKKTCFWLKNLPLLQPTNIVEPELKHYVCKNGKQVTFNKKYAWATSNNRSKTYPGIAKAMAEQWGKII